MNHIVTGSKPSNFFTERISPYYATLKSALFLLSYNSSSSYITVEVVVHEDTVDVEEVEVM